MEEALLTSIFNKLPDDGPVLKLARLLVKHAGLALPDWVLPDWLLSDFPKMQVNEWITAHITI
jgi:hypothetical protein